MAELGIDDVAIAAIAKGPDRNAGRERFFQPGRTPFSLEPRDPVLYFLQRLRDEAHRFAIGAHRTKRAARLPTERIRHLRTMALSLSPPPDETATTVSTAEPHEASTLPQSLFRSSPLFR